MAIIESRAELMAKVKAGLSEQEQPQQVNGSICVIETSVMHYM